MSRVLYICIYVLCSIVRLIVQYGTVRQTLCLGIWDLLCKFGYWCWILGLGSLDLYLGLGDLDLGFGVRLGALGYVGDWGLYDLDLVTWGL
jgi:hypothetical protein